MNTRYAVAYANWMFDQMEARFAGGRKGRFDLVHKNGFFCPAGGDMSFWVSNRVTRVMNNRLNDQHWWQTHHSSIGSVK
jgi:hypothetical protein